MKRIFFIVVGALVVALAIALVLHGPAPSHAYAPPRHPVRVSVQQHTIQQIIPTTGKPLPSPLPSPAASPGS